MHAASEEKPITVDRPNRTYVLYPASGMKFDETCETRDEARARALNRTMCSIGRHKTIGQRRKYRTRASRRTNEARYQLNYRRPPTPATGNYGNGCSRTADSAVVVIMQQYTGSTVLTLCNLGNLHSCSWCCKSQPFNDWGTIRR